VFVRSLHHTARGTNGCPKKSLQSPVILGEKAGDGPRLISLWLHHRFDKLSTGQRTLMLWLEGYP
jgi:hypothetical protein